MKTLSLTVLNSAPVKQKEIKSLLCVETNYKLKYTAVKEKAVVAGLSLSAAYKVKDAKGCTKLDTCAYSTVSCRAACVTTKVGCSVYSNVIRIRKAKTELFATNLPLFKEILIKDIQKVVNSVKAKAKKTKKKAKQIYIRLNVSSDLAYETIFPELFTMFPMVQFYDYTKGIHRINKNLPSNYSLTYSFNEDSNLNKVQTLLEQGFNVAAIVDTYYYHGKKGELPKTITLGGENYPVQDGDISDIRTKAHDGSGKIIALRFKGSKKNKAMAIETGFCLKV